MFSALGSFAHKYRFYILACWLVITIFLVFQAPPLSEVGVTDQSQFLPEKTESVYARNLLNEKFGSGVQESSGLIVVYNEQGLNQQDMDEALKLRNWLISDNGPGPVTRVTSIFDSEALRASLVSKDDTTMMMSVAFSSSALDEEAKQAIKTIRQQFDLYPETSFYFTGNVGFIHDLFESVQRTIDNTTLVTIILVIVLLLIVYRSPFAALVPLIAIGISFLVARGIIGFLAQAGLDVSTVIDAYMVVTIFGVGTDYCLFIISRYREETARAENTRGIDFTMRQIGPVILASAVTVIIAFLCLSVSSFGMTKTSGYALAIGIAVTLAAGLTLVPALMSIFGRFLFWPTKNKPKDNEKLKKRRWGWAKTGEWISRHPVLTAVPIIIVLIIPYFAIPGLTLSANVLTQLSPSEESSQGLNIIRDHFPVGELSPLTLVLQSESGSLLTPDSLEGIDQMAQELTRAEDLSRVDYPSLVGNQLIGLGQQVKGLGDMITSPGFSLSSLSMLQSQADQLEALTLEYPSVAQSPNFISSSAILAQVSSLAEQLVTASPSELPGLISQLQTSLYDLGDALTALGNEFRMEGSGPFVDRLKAVYFSADGTVARMYLILDIDPYSNEASLALPRIREAVTSTVATSSLGEIEHYVGGETALYADMVSTSNDDLTIVIVVTSIGILAVIVILLRSLLASLYMVITVLLNYGATLGIITWIFIDILKFESLINMLPVFVFVMLAAVGADYNIFLVSRIREESENKSIKEAVHHAVANTGNVITSCGIILAGTFATLASSTFPMVLQIGVAIAIGVLIDTFLVRALLVPSLATLLGRWNWWPSPLFRRMKKD
ncbi:MAG: MMPL family transporter [Dehalococcoidales bacterium]|nr:MMPL family transporter [Dehalococcoidales bacterium]